MRNRKMAKLFWMKLMGYMKKKPPTQTPDVLAFNYLALCLIFNIPTLKRCFEPESCIWKMWMNCNGVLHLINIQMRHWASPKGGCFFISSDFLVFTVFRKMFSNFWKRKNPLEGISSQLLKTGVILYNYSSLKVLFGDFSCV